MIRRMTNLCPSEEDICDCCAAMFDALNGGDLDEQQRAAIVYTVHTGIGEFLYLAVWERLDAPFRAAWKANIDAYRAVQRAVLRDCRRAGR